MPKGLRRKRGVQSSKTNSSYKIIGLCIITFLIGLLISKIEFQFNRYQECYKDYCIDEKVKIVDGRYKGSVGNVYALRTDYVKVYFVDDYEIVEYNEIEKLTCPKGKICIGE